MTSEEMKKKFWELYQYMATSENVAYMRAFGNVHKEMMDWMIANKPSGPGMDRETLLYQVEELPDTEGGREDCFRHGAKSTLEP